MKITIFDLGNKEKNKSVIQQVQNYYNKSNKNIEYTLKDINDIKIKKLRRMLELLVENPWEMCN